MSKNIKKQGKHIGYIIGGIFSLILGALLVLLYLPTALTLIVGIEPIWDFSDTFTSLFGANLMDMLYIWLPAGVLILCAGIYFVCLFARQSTASTMFRLSAMSSCLALAVPQLFTALLLMTGSVDLTAYGGYATFGLFILSFILYVIGFVARIKQKYHENRATTLLVFASTFWMLLALFPALQVLNVLMGTEIAFLIQASTIVNASLLGIVSVFLIIASIWMFITIPHRVVVDYNPDTRHLHKGGRPKVLSSHEMPTLADQPQMTQFASQDYPSYQQPQQTQGYQHNFNQPTQVQNNFNQNPVFNPTPQYNVPPQPRPQVAPTQPFIAPQPAPQPKQAPQQNQNISQPNNPYASYNNFAQNNPYNRPQPQPRQPQTPMFQPANQQQNRPQINQNVAPVQPARPVASNQLAKPAPQRPQPQPQAPRPNPFAQAPVQAQRPMSSQPQAPRPPVTPFNNPQRNPNNNNNNPNSNAV